MFYTAAIVGFGPFDRQRLPLRARQFDSLRSNIGQEDPFDTDPYRPHRETCTQNSGSYPQNR
jgi:hypothetical protein